jgi:MerR family transcriptional regulator, light-induced transcriptional regulator
MGAYKIKDLENLTGIKAHTIRIWEKRYGILKPERTETQIRKYDDDELTLLLNVSLLNKNGYKISRIADMSPEDMKLKLSKKISNYEDCFHENLLLSLIEINEKLFNETIQNLIDEIGLEQTFTKHLVPFLEKIGIMWILGTINPAQEHFISNLIRQKLISEIDKLPFIEDGKKVLLYLPEHENHEISLLFYCFVLKKHKIKTYYLGQLLPYDSLLLSIEKIKPDAIVTSFIAALDKDFLKNYFGNLIRDIDPKIEIFSGGLQMKDFENNLSRKINKLQSIDDLKVIFPQ